MATIEKLSIALPPDMAAQLRQAVETGEYSSSSAIVEDALRDWTEKRTLHQGNVVELRRLWQEARADKSDGLDPDPIFEAIERKYHDLAAASGDLE